MDRLSRVRRGWRIAVVGVIAAGSLVLSACAPGAAEPGDGAAAPDLVIAASTQPNSLDPAQLIDGQQGYVWGSIFDTLLQREYNTGEIVPNLATAWEYNDDGTELTLTLRDDATFSSGGAVDADAVVATMMRTKETPGLVQPKMEYVEAVEAVDATTVRITFSQFDPRFLYLLTNVLGVVGDPETLAEERTATDPVGSGPYVLDAAQTVPGNVYVLTKRDDYWNEDLYPFETVRVRVIADPAASFNALQAGEVTAATARPQQLGQLDEATYTKTPFEPQSVVALNILDRAGETWPALGDVRVRQAINMAVDREGILTGIAGGSGAVAQQTFRPSGPIYDEELNERYPYDVDAARALVEEAGYTGTTFKIPSTFLSTQYEAALTGAFEAIGLGIEWVPVPPQQAQSVLTGGEYGLYFQIIALKDPAMDTIDWFATNGYGNPRGYTDPTLDELFARINSTVEFEDAIPVYRELNEHVVDEALIVPINYAASTWVTRDGITVRDDGSSGAFMSVRLFGLPE